MFALKPPISATPRRFQRSRKPVKPMAGDLSCMSDVCQNITTTSKIVGNYIGMVVLLSSSLNYLYYRRIRKEQEKNDKEN